MSAEISKTKSPPAPSESTKKYLKKAELEAQRQEAYIREQAALQREHEAKIQQKRKRDEDEALRAQERDEKRRRLAEESRARREEQEAKEEKARRKRLGLPELPIKGSEADAENTNAPHDEADISDSELTSKLRALNEPIILFGETHLLRLKRFRTLTAATTLTGTSPSNDFIPTTLAAVPESEMKVPTIIPKGQEAQQYLYRQLASYFNMILLEWARTLSQRESAVAQSTQGRIAEATMRSSVSHMRPLFRKFEQQSAFVATSSSSSTSTTTTNSPATPALPDSMLAPLLEIVSAAQERRYVDANDGYLRLSIGKAAWPIGVTMVGIHERSAREKLHESDKGQAHVMGDEVTRKFLQSIKRCLSFAQVRWPPEDLGQLMG